jgi:hypothetical protein
MRRTSAPALLISYGADQIEPYLWPRRICRIVGTLPTISFDETGALLGRRHSAHAIDRANAYNNRVGPGAHGADLDSRRTFALTCIR